MSKIAVIYWSGTGNTEAMADLVANAAAAGGSCVGDQIGHGLGVAGAAPIDNCNLAHK